VKKLKIKAFKRKRRKRKIRARVSGTETRPRLSVFRSSKYIYAQVIDDKSGRTLASASDQIPQLREELKGLKKSERAEKVGEFLAEKCKSAGIETVIFDRNGFLFHGRVKALADGARKGGLEF